MKWRLTVLCWLVMLGQAQFAPAEDCTEARRLARAAYDLGQAAAALPEKQRLLARAVALCPQFPEAQNNLADVLEQQGQAAQAIAHYQEAVRLQPDLTPAWLSLGKLYAAAGQLPLALEAYLHACQQEPAARPAIAALLEENRYQAAADGTIFNKASLLLLFDRTRRAALDQMLAQCRFRSGDDFASRGVQVEPAAEFPNLLFDTGQATLKPESLPQIRELGAALRALGDNAQISIAGHTDKQGFQGVADAAENLRRNIALSQARAQTVADMLAQAGMPRAQLTTQGFGPTQPAIAADTPAAYARNRRVVVTVQ